MGEAKLKQCVYVSRQTREFSIEDLRDLMRRARENNNRLDLSGLLLFDRPTFLQVLEGSIESVDSLMDIIKADKRHKNVDVIYCNDNLAEREFSRWRMGLKILGQGLPDYHQLDRRVKRILNVAEPNGESAHQLLLEFRELKNCVFDSE